MGPNLNLEHEKDRGVVRISGGGLGMVFIIVKNKIKLGDAIPYEANEEGRCIGFEVEDSVSLEVFHVRIREFAEENSIEIVD